MSFVQLWCRLWPEKMVVSTSAERNKYSVRKGFQSYANFPNV
jgi:hypothetical protein